ILGYLQRGGVPTAASRVLACEFGHHAVELLLKGEKKSVVGIRGGEIASADLEYTCSKRKELDLHRFRLAKVLSS
ncbi:MAG: ATP-dependent 6-phosphofructokinase, partial [Nitrososphaeria archaeon]|nr:ATP-dependent 6-phosphofructokinase [Nitrososphaeria archaeon]